METKGLKMLVVDDEVGMLMLLKEVFESRGWTVITSPIGDSIWPILEEEKIAVVLLDIRLPGTSGLDILKDIKSKFSGIPVIMFTALGYKDELVNKAMRLGASGYVSKGVPIIELIEVVNNALIR